MYLNLRLMLFCSANWIPLTISGSSGTMASTVTLMKYCTKYKKNTLRQTIHRNSIFFYVLIWSYQKRTSGVLNTWEMVEWVSMGSMFSVLRSAQQAINTVAIISTARALHRDQCTT